MRIWVIFQTMQDNRGQMSQREHDVTLTSLPMCVRWCNVTGLVEQDCGSWLVPGGCTKSGEERWSCARRSKHAPFPMWIRRRWWCGGGVGIPLICERAVQTRGGREEEPQFELTWAGMCPLSFPTFCLFCLRWWIACFVRSVPVSLPFFFFFFVSPNRRLFAPSSLSPASHGVTALPSLSCLPIISDQCCVPAHTSSQAGIRFVCKHLRACVNVCFWYIRQKVWPFLKKF